MKSMLSWSLPNGVMAGVNDGDGDDSGKRLRWGISGIPILVEVVNRAKEGRRYRKSASLLHNVSIGFCNTYPFISAQETANGLKFIDA